MSRWAERKFVSLLDVEKNLLFLDTRISGVGVLCRVIVVSVLFRNISCIC